MNEVKFEKLKDFGTIHRNDKRIIVVSLTRSTSKDKDGEDKETIYFSFHEHYKDNEGKLLPRRTKPNPNSKFEEKVISFTLPFTKETTSELYEVANSMKNYMADRAKPANKERF
jgi:hypothetical protein